MVKNVILCRSSVVFSSSSVLHTSCFIACIFDRFIKLLYNNWESAHIAILPNAGHRYWAEHGVWSILCYQFNISSVTLFVQRLKQFLWKVLVVRLANFSIFELSVKEKENYTKLIILHALLIDSTVNWVVLLYSAHLFSNNLYIFIVVI